MNFQETLDEWKQNTGLDDVGEQTLQRLNKEIFQMAGLQDMSKAIAIEVSMRYLHDDAEAFPNMPAGWVVLYCEDADYMNLYRNGQKVGHFGFSAQGAIACFGEVFGKEYKCFIKFVDDKLKEVPVWKEF